jgi:hypothetical protein
MSENYVNPWNSNAMLLYSGIAMLSMISLQCVSYVFTPKESIRRYILTVTHHQNLDRQTQIICHLELMQARGASSELEGVLRKNMLAQANFVVSLG